MNITITVMGMGYIGLPTALLLAEAGNNVRGFDINEDKIRTLQEGSLPFEENGLGELFERVKASGKFSAITKLTPSDVYLIAVPTPQIDHSSDLQYVFSAIDKIQEVFKDGDTVIIESTVGPTDCETEIIPRIKKIGKRFRFASCPERAIPGNTLYEMIHNSRIIGGLTPEDADYIKQIYSTFVKGEVYMTIPVIASTCKVMENTYRDVNIALANEFARVADEVGFNVWEAISLANKHPRVNILQPGPGVGGHCIPIDPWFFTAISRQTDLILTSRKINDNMPAYVANQVKQIVEKKRLENPIVGVLGYAYKKNVDDSRETPVERLVEELSKDYKVLISDPFVGAAVIEIMPLEEVLSSCSIIVLATDHDQYKAIMFKQYPNIKAVYDTRNLFSIDNMSSSEAVLYTLGAGLK